MRIRLLVMVMVATACMSSASTAGAAGPASGRAWELLTPAKPNSATVFSAVPLNGDDGRVLYETLGPQPGAPSGAMLSSNLALREEGGWSTTPLGIPFEFNSPELFEQLIPTFLAGLSDDNATAIWLSATPLMPGAPPEGHAGLYRQGPDGTLSLIGDLGEQPLIILDNYVDLSTDGVHTLFTDEEHLLPTDSGRTEGMSIYDSTEADLQQVDVTTGGTLLSSCGSALSAANGTSEDGRRIFFNNPDPSTSCIEPSRVYFREGGATIEASASHCTRLDCNAPADIEFAGATPRGSSVFMTTTQQLTNDDIDETRDLYRYEVNSGALTLISGSPPEANGEVSEGVVYPSGDGSRVYFCAKGKLVVGEGSEAGENLYLADEGGLHSVTSLPCPEEIQLARGGRSVLLVTATALVAGDTDEKKDVYLYEADSHTMTLLSTGPSGGNGVFEASIESGLGETLNPGRERIFRSITEDGNEAFFTTKEQLVPEDVNEASDVYEWAGEHLDLVSSGTGEGSVKFGSVSADGRTVLFETTAALLPADVDGGDGDLYVARKGGGFPEPEQESKCIGASCEVAPRSRVDRPPSVSSVHHHKGKLRLLGVVGSGSPILKVAAPQPGLITAKGKTQLGSRTRTIAHGSRGTIHSGVVRISLHLSAAARRVLSRGETLKVQMVVREADLRFARTINLGLGGGR